MIAAQLSFQLLQELEESTARSSMVKSIEARTLTNLHLRATPVYACSDNQGYRSSSSQRLLETAPTPLRAVWPATDLPAEAA